MKRLKIFKTRLVQEGINKIYAGVSSFGCAQDEVTIQKSRFAIFMVSGVES